MNYCAKSFIIYWVLGHLDFTFAGPTSLVFIEIHSILFVSVIVQQPAHGKATMDLD